MNSPDGLFEEIAEEVETLSREAAWPKRGRKRRKLAFGVAFVVLAGLLVVWTQRKPIARNFVADELEKRGVDARYEIKKIGFSTQRLENLSLGDPRNPDLTADWAEITTSIGLGTVKVTGVRAGGVRLRGKLIDGTFSFGQIDKLLPAPTGKPFTLPDLNLGLQDARVRLDLPNGQIGLKLEGNGNLTGGFKGKIAAVAPALMFGDCRVSDATAWLDLSISDRQPRVAGPVRAEQFGCAGAGLSLAAPQANVDARLNEALNSWRGNARLQIANAVLGGNRLDSVRGAVGFDGGRRGTNGGIDVSAQSVSAAGVSGQNLRLDGRYTLGAQRGGQLIALGGTVSLEKAALDKAMLMQIASYASMADNTPVAPLVKALAEAAVRAGQEARIDGEFALEQKGNAGSLRIASVSALSKSGLRLALNGGGVALAWPGAGKVQVNGRLSLGGGGFPSADIQLEQAATGAAIRGTASIAPYAAGDARLALTPVRFDAGTDGQTRFDTQVTLDGPLGDGRVTGLTLPLSGRLDGKGGFAVNPGCAPLSFRSLAISGLALGESRMALCPYGGTALVARQNGRLSGGARVANIALNGRLGENPISIKAASAHYALGSGALAADALALRLGPADLQTRLDIARLDGRMVNGALAGNFADTSGKLMNVPLILSEAAGRWTFENGSLALGGAIRISDEQQPAPRFNPLVSQDFALTFSKGQIMAGGILREPKSGVAVTKVNIAHDLGRGRGNAVLDVSNLQFGDTIQPDTLTPLALGVIANVVGSVNGQGRIAWTPQGVTSDGGFSTTDANMAAAFGPVTGLSTDIRFTDLLGLVTAPGQRATVKEVNPGIPVKDGVIRYQLLPEQRVSIEGGDWPFAAGNLVLDPTILDMGAAKARNLTFRVTGMDAAVFLQAYEFQNINATGVFDGVLPMVFDEQGGRIVNGHLIVREGGGNLAYIGAVSKENLGAWGNFAFDTLRSVNYRTLEILLNGDLAGEMVTEVKFAGLSQGAGAKSNFLTRKIAKLPIRFNVRIAAPFRQLIFSARSLYDPSVLIEQNLDALIRVQDSTTSSGETPQSVVQPSESEQRP